MMSSEGENERNKNYFPNKQQKCFTGSGVAHTRTWAENREKLGGRVAGMWICCPEEEEKASLRHEKTAVLSQLFFALSD